MKAIVYIPGMGQCEITLTKYGRKHPVYGSNYSGELKTDAGMIALYVNGYQA